MVLPLLLCFSHLSPSGMFFFLWVVVALWSFFLPWGVRLLPLVGCVCVCLLALWGHGCAWLLPFGPLQLLLIKSPSEPNDRTSQNPTILHWQTMKLRNRLRASATLTSEAGCIFPRANNFKQHLLSSCEAGRFLTSSAKSSKESEREAESIEIQKSP